MSEATAHHSEEGGRSHRTSLRELLADYDREVDMALRQALEATTGTDRVRFLHGARRLIVVHDGVLRSALCPLLNDLPGGPAVAKRLEEGCEERVALLRRFDQLTKGVAVHNVYPASGQEIEEILSRLEQSMGRHVDEETAQVSDVLENAADSVDPEVVASLMALEARRAPTRAHPGAAKHARSTLVRRLYRLMDRKADWTDAHHGWSTAGPPTVPIRTLEAHQLKREALEGSPTVRDVLAGYDRTVSSLIDELAATTSTTEWAQAAERLNAAITVHDAVLGGVLCPLLEKVPESAEAGARLRAGCQRRAELQRSLSSLSEHGKLKELPRDQREEAKRLVDQLIASFRAHEEQETNEVTALLEKLPPDAYRTKTSPFADVMWPWHSEGPELLALRMALWAQSSPTVRHPLLDRHPSSRLLRSWFHLVDAWNELWADSPLKRWLSPKLPEPFGERATSVVPDGPAPVRSDERPSSRH